MRSANDSFRGIANGLVCNSLALAISAQISQLLTKAHKSPSHCAHTASVMMNIYKGSSTVDIYERAAHKTRVVHRQTVTILTKRRNSLAPLPSNPAFNESKGL